MLSLDDQSLFAVLARYARARREGADGKEAFQQARDHARALHATGELSDAGYVVAVDEIRGYRDIDSQGS